jgi:predicted methyltransferase
VIRILFAAALFAAAAPAAVLAQTIPPMVSAAVADPGRPAPDTARDVNRHPAEVVAFAGVKSGMVVGELIPGSGYYTRILAKAVGPTGKVYALVPPFMATRPGALDGLNAIAKAYPNVRVVVADLNAPMLPEKLDLYWTTENYHDMHIGQSADTAGFNKAVYDSLKPGGTFLIEDHAAKVGAGPGAPAALHRVEEAQTKAELQAAGFRLDGESSVNRNPADTHEANSHDASIQAHTDRFLLRFKRP